MGRDALAKLSNVAGCPPTDTDTSSEEKEPLGNSVWSTVKVTSLVWELPAGERWNSTPSTTTVAGKRGSKTASVSSQSLRHDCGISLRPPWRVTGNSLTAKILPRTAARCTYEEKPSKAR